MANITKKSCEASEEHLKADTRHSIIVLRFFNILVFINLANKFLVFLINQIMQP